MTTLHDRLALMLQTASTSTSAHVQTMKTTVEDSQWHREANVWVHTEMVTNEFLDIWEKSGHDLNDRIMFCTGVAALFHDFGKPEAEDERVNAQGTKYRRYAGHEAISASEFRYLVTSSGWLELFGEEPMFTPDEIFAIALMIQHHLPYAYKPELRAAVLNTIKYFNGGDAQPFFSLLRADARGRISDDHDIKLANVETWIEEAEQDSVVPFVEPNDKMAYVLIGPSGSGKSSFLDRFDNGVNFIEIFSQDALRLELYGDDTITDPQAHYHSAWKASVDDSTNFRAVVTKRVNAVVKSDAAVAMSDNMNLVKKARREFIAAAKQAGRTVVAVVFVSVGVDELVSRGISRNNRGIPPARLKDMFMQLYLPAFDEVDMICVM